LSAIVNSSISNGEVSTKPGQLQWSAEHESDATRNHDSYTTLRDTIQPVCTETDFCKGKSFGTVLAYLSGATAVAATDAVDHALALRNGRDAMLVENDPDIWGDTIAELVLDVSRRSGIAENGRSVFESRFTMDEYACRLDLVLRSLIAPR
jgi:glycosyltransferase involved in cell wall biosynthesis